MRRLCGLLCVAALAAAGSAGAVLNGTFDGTMHPYVGAFTDGTETCSGFLVSPTVVVTAAHCFPEGAAVRGSFDPAPQGSNVFGTAHPDPNFDGQSADVAVIVLQAAQPGPYASLPAPGALDKLAKKTQLTLVGYGANTVTRGGGRPQPLLLGQRTRADVEASNAPGKLSAQFLKLASGGGGNKPAACFGDSGGPDLVPGTNLAVGVTSFGSNQVCSGPSYSFRLDTAEAQSFLAPFLS
jgi:hypothetical protein